jgi:inosine-uridine nucleoside N-ribohydrolase
MKQRFTMTAPVFRGAEQPLGPRLGAGYPDFVHGKNGLGDIAFAEPQVRAETLPGPQAIVDFAQRYPGELSVVAVGRLTNIALALKLCPELGSLLKEVVVMGGQFGFNGHRGNVSPVAEANIAGDPLAADLVFTAGLPLTIVGLDVTTETLVDEAFFTRVRANGGDAGALVYDTSRGYLDFNERVRGQRCCPVHDSSAVAFLLRPQLFTTRRVVVRAVTEGIALGQTIFAEPDPSYQIRAWHDTPTCQICTGVDAQAVVEFCTTTLTD